MEHKNNCNKPKIQWILAVTLDGMLETQVSI